MQDDNANKPPNPRKLANLPRPAPYKRVGTMPIEAVKQVTRDIVKSSDRAIVSAKNVRELVSQNTDGGKMLIRFFLNAIEGQIPGVSGQARVRAAEFLSHYCFGKPVDTVVSLSYQKNDNTPLDSFNDGELENFARGLLQVRDEIRQENEEKKQLDKNIIDAEIVPDEGGEKP